MQAEEDVVKDTQKREIQTMQRLYRESRSELD